MNLLNLLAVKINLLAIVGNSCSSSFFGLRPWWYYLPNGDFDGCNVRSFHFISASGNDDIPLVLLAVVDDLLRIAGIVAVAFVLIGAFKYVASQGDPEATGRAQGTVINALVGMAVAITAAVFVNFLGQRLGGG